MRSLPLLWNPMCFLQFCNTAFFSSPVCHCFSAIMNVTWLFLVRLLTEKSFWIARVLARCWYILCQPITYSDYPISNYFHGHYYNFQSSHSETCEHNEHWTPGKNQKCLSNKATNRRNSLISYRSNANHPIQSENQTKTKTKTKTKQETRLTEHNGNWPIEIDWCELVCCKCGTCIFASVHNRFVSTDLNGITKHLFIDINEEKEIFARSVNITFRIRLPLFSKIKSTEIKNVCGIARHSTKSIDTSSPSGAFDR